MTRVLAAFLISASFVTLDAQGPPPAATSRVPGLAERVRGAQKVVVATVTDVQARFDVNEFGDRLIVTEAALQVDESLKGNASQFERLDVEGGTIGDLTLSVSDMPTLRRGERAVFLLDATVSGSNRPHGRGTGVMKVDRNDVVEDTGMSLNDVRAAVRGAGR